MKTLASLTFLRYKGRKLILIGDNLAYEYWLKKMYGIIVAKRIHYTAESTFESVYEQLNEHYEVYMEHTSQGTFQINLLCVYIQALMCLKLYGHVVLPCSPTV